jgi:hypothetical protein
MCRACHEKRQSESAHCALCDQVIVQAYCAFYHRDATDVGPPVPCCNACVPRLGALGSNAPVWQGHVAEPKLYTADPIPERKGPTMFDLAWAVMSPAERAALVARTTAEADAAFGPDAAEPKP